MTIPADTLRSEARRIAKITDDFWQGLQKIIRDH
jgi:hypothetical protein